MKNDILKENDTMNEKLLEVKNLVVDYETDEETVHAVNGISFTINKGETFGIVGETGAGKTTTALSIMKLLPSHVGKVKEGTISFYSENLLEQNEQYLREIRGEKISMIFQDPMTSLNPVLTVGDQIGEALELHATVAKKDIPKRVGEIMELVGIPAGRMNEFPHQFSGGMKQRMVIAIALACEPELIIADEPTTALDVTIQAQVLELMQELKDKMQTSMIMITHDLGIVAQICDKVAIMYAGEIIENGTLEDIFSGDLHHPYTVGLFNSIPKISDKRARLQSIEGLMPDPTNLPEGCKFHPRCAHCIDKCKTESPSHYQKGTHEIKCHLF